MQIQFKDKIKSSEDNTLKYVFKTTDNLIIEFSYIDKNDGKDIICAPVQTMCNIGCKFCHTTDYINKIKCRNITSSEIYNSIKYILDDLNIFSNKKVLLVSFMGCGEPILNVDNIVTSMLELKKLEPDIPFIRFALATSIPKNSWLNFFNLTDKIQKYKLPLKLHLSLHYTVDLIRKEWMPLSLDIISSLSCVDFYRKITQNSVEIHYTLIDGVNDTEQDAILLSNFLKDKDINIKFIKYNEKKNINYIASDKKTLSLFKRYFDKYSIKHEYYVPPGASIGSSCGAFLMETYLKYK